MKTVLIVDDDLGFLFWLAKALGNAGYNVVPAVSISKARSIVSDLALMPDLLIINPAVQASSELIRALKLESPGVRTVAAVEPQLPEARWAGLDVDWWGRKPLLPIVAKGAIPDPESDVECQERLSVARAEWLLIVRTALGGRASGAD